MTRITRRNAHLFIGQQVTVTGRPSRLAPVTETGTLTAYGPYMLHLRTAAGFRQIVHSVVDVETAGE